LHHSLRINDLTMRLRPVVDDARVFMDKIAREPGPVVGGAIASGPGIKQLQSGDGIAGLLLVFCAEASYSKA
jgi:hypothetical protein